MQWVLYVNTDKGWKEEFRHKNKIHFKNILNEWLDEFPKCKFMIERNKK
jgi:hypothetical protein